MFPTFKNRIFRMKTIKILRRTIFFKSYTSSSVEGSINRVSPAAAMSRAPFVFLFERNSCFSSPSITFFSSISVGCLSYFRAYSWLIQPCFVSYGLKFTSNSCFHVLRSIQSLFGVSHQQIKSIPRARFFPN